MEVERVVANTPCYSAFLTGSGCLVRLALDTEVHDVISANGTIIDDNIPCPKSYGVPLLDLELLLGVNSLAVGGSIAHLDVRHREL